MAHLTTILSELETAIRANASFANAVIYQRGEMESDEIPQTVGVYLKPLDMRPNITPQKIDFRIYPVRITVAFEENERALDETQRDVPTEDKATYIDALCTVLQSLAVTDVFQVDVASSSMEPEVPAEIRANEDRRNLHRVEIVAEFHTADAMDVVDGGAYGATTMPDTIDGGSY